MPDSPSDIATFDQSAITDLSIVGDSIDLDSMVFDSVADAYAIDVAGANLQFYGAGIVNNSTVMQTITRDPHGLLTFSNWSSAGERTSISGPGETVVFYYGSSGGSAVFDVTNDGDIPASVTFEDSSTASQASIVLNDHGQANFYNYSTAANASIDVNTAGALFFGDNSTADHVIATVNSDGAEFVGSGVSFTGSATAANGNFTASGATSSTGFGSYLNFSGTSAAGDATFVLNGGTTHGAAGAAMAFYDTSIADQANITVNGGTNGGKGASVAFYDFSLGGTARLSINGGGSLDIGRYNSGGVTIGSLAGDGRVTLGSGALSVGAITLIQPSQVRFGTAAGATVAG